MTVPRASPTELLSTFPGIGIRDHSYPDLQEFSVAVKSPCPIPPSLLYNSYILLNILTLNMHAIFAAGFLAINNQLIFSKRLKCSMYASLVCFLLNRDMRYLINLKKAMNAIIMNRLENIVIQVLEYFHCIQILILVSF